MSIRSHRQLTALAVAVLGFTFNPAAAVPVFLPLGAIQPGTENTTLVPNGGFEAAGADTGGNHFAFPAVWSRVNDMFVVPTSGVADAPVPSVPANGNFVAVVHTDGGSAPDLYLQNITLLPNTAYVLSAYMWNFGDASNNVRANVDLQDAPGEANLLLTASEFNADEGYFVFDTFTTATTGTNLTLRVFDDGQVGTGTSAAFFPHGAQWDNIAITLASNFVAPAAFAVPEPTTAALLGAAGLTLLRRRRTA